jgi:heptosyltransferase-2
VAKYALLAGASNCEEKLYLDVQKKIFTKPTIAVAPGAAFGKAKRWPYFSECLKILAQAKDFDIVILGAGSDKESCDELANKLSAHGVKYQNLVGKTSLTELAQIIGGVSLFLTNDSGPMHISAALNTPCIAIFGSTDADLTGPWMAPKCLVVQNKVDCAPCFKRECRYNSYECLVGVSPKQVANIAIGVLNG